MGFKLRSGNGPLQFKQLEASPAKGIGDWFRGHVPKTAVDIENEQKVKTNYQAQKSDFKTTRKDFKAGNKQEIQHEI